MAASTPVRRAGRCEIVLFHSVLGLRPAVRDWADRLRAAGHVVHVPDLYEGATFDDYDAGFRHLEAIGGIATLVARTQAAAIDLPTGLVYMGFSNGGASAELLALTRPGARGVVLLHAALPIHAFEAEAWPAGVPVQLHYGTDDPYREQAEIDAFAESVRAAGAPYEAHDYPGNGHLFADPGLPEHDPAAAALMLERVLAFLDRVGAGDR